MTVAKAIGNGKVGFTSVATNVREMFTFRRNGKTPIQKSEPVALTAREWALKLQNEGMEEKKNGQAGQAVSRLVQSAYYYNESRQPEMACRMLARAAGIYERAGEKEKSRAHYQAAADLAGLWGLEPLRQHYQKLANEEWTPGEWQGRSWFY